MNATQTDIDTFNRIPKNEWFAAGSLGIHGSKLARLERLGLVDKRPPLLGLGVSRTWDWKTTRDTLPCPFCGGKATPRRYASTWAIGCDECGCSLTGDTPSYKEIITRWNQREIL